MSVNDLLNLVAKAMYNGAEMPSVIGGMLKLPQRVVQLVLEQAKERKMIDMLGASGASVASELRYTLTEKGRQWAVDAHGAEPVFRAGAGAARRARGAHPAPAHHQRARRSRGDREAPSAT